jgi:two-component system, NtrC family, C4-dicarboxylate transport response regulator DctD
MSSHLPKRPYDRTSNVLIVDDDDTLLKFFKIHLNKFFSKVVVVENAKQALDTMKTKEIDVVLSDIRMPKIDGLQLMGKIRKEHPDIPILLVSGEPMDDEQQSELDKADGFLPKPFTVDQLNDFIHFGADFRQTLKTLAACLKDPKKVRDALNADAAGLKKLCAAGQTDAANSIVAQWKEFKDKATQSAA